LLTHSTQPLQEKNLFMRSTELLSCICGILIRQGYSSRLSLLHERCSLGAVNALAHGKYRQPGQSAPHFMRVCRNYATICRPWTQWKTVWNHLHRRWRRFESCSAHSLRGCPFGTALFLFQAPLYRVRTRNLGVISPFLKCSN
jgi:hypothetical protein